MGPFQSQGQDVGAVGLLLQLVFIKHRLRPRQELGTQPG